MKRSSIHYRTVIREGDVDGRWVTHVEPDFDRSAGTLFCGRAAPGTDASETFTAANGVVYFDDGAFYPARAQHQ